MGVILGGAPEAVLGRQQSDKPSTAETGEQLDGMIEPAIDRCLVGEQPEPPPAEKPRAVMDQRLEAGLHARHGGIVTRSVLRCPS